MNLATPDAVSALEAAFAEMLDTSPSGFATFEASAEVLANACRAAAMGRAPTSSTTWPTPTP